MNTLMLLASAALLSQISSPGFPHQAHTRFFPLCEGCHSGIVMGVASKAYPGEDECATCHDGTSARRKRVVLNPRLARTSNLTFSHTQHRKASTQRGKTATCPNCHGVPGAPRMSVGAPQPAGCMTCHAGKGESHLSPTMQCATCHLPLTRAQSVPRDKVGQFPRPSWHEANDFLAQHGRGSAERSATCSVCHARNTCERCHANADDVPLIRNLQRDARVADLEAGKPARYFAPGSHTREWSTGHARAAKRETKSCSNCHVQSSCVGCHQSGSTSRPVIAGLPAVPMRPGGKMSVTNISRRVHPADNVRTHGVAAATNRSECTQCHSKLQCAGCHSGSDSRRFHTLNYAERHAPDVFASSSRCQSCHSTETFCRACHSNAGVAAGRMNAAFHNAQPMWVLAHGQAARLGMEACASCHRQTDCTRCHSAAGGWGVNPHRNGFDANRLAARGSASCRLCHLNNPVKGN